MKRNATSCLVLLFALLALAPSTAAQRRGEYLTEGEMELVQGLREIDKRTEIFLKVASRRLLAIQDPNAEVKEGFFTNYKFGPLPTGTQVELLGDYRRALDELMIKLEDEFERKGLSGELKKALELVISEVDQQLKIMDGLAPKLTESEAPHFLERAKGTARELATGARAALAAKPGKT